MIMQNVTLNLKNLTWISLYIKFRSLNPILEHDSFSYNLINICKNMNTLKCIFIRQINISIIET